MGVKFCAIVVILALYFYSVDCAKCYTCRSTCITSKIASLQEKINGIQSMTDACKQMCANPNPDTPSEDCSEDKGCYSVLSILARKDKDGNALKTHHIRRGCMPKCSKQKVCDLKKMNSCGYPQYISNFIRKELSDGMKALNGIIENSFGVKADLGTGGELVCCEGDKCNAQTEPEIAHTYIRDEL